MSSLYQEIGEKFLNELAKCKDVSEGKLKALRELLANGKKLKVDDLVSIFTSTEDDEVK